jgi:hypothetical protein
MTTDDTKRCVAGSTIRPTILLRDLRAGRMLGANEIMPRNRRGKFDRESNDFGQPMVYCDYCNLR